MSKYTTQVRFICENLSGLNDSAGFSRVNDIIQSAIPKVFDFYFPIYDESYRNVLCSKILKHYYTREIGLETVGLWKLHLDMKLNEIMPYYNQMYKSAMIDFNPMYDVDLTTTMDKDTGGTTETNDEDKTINNYTDTKNANNTRTTEYGRTVTTNNSGNSTDETNNDGSSTQRDLYSDTPQGSLDNVENETYLTNARKNVSEGQGHSKTVTNFSNNGSSSDGGSDTATDTVAETIARTGDGTITKKGNSTVSTTEDYVLKVIGKTSGTSYSKLLNEFRATFINIDRMIIDELADLFFNLW